MQKSNMKKRLKKLIDTHGFDVVLKITGYSGSTLGMYADQESRRNIPIHKLELAERKLCDLIPSKP